VSLTVSNVLLALLLVSCFGSFTWAVRRFFVRPERSTPGLKFTLLTGTAFAIIHLVVILRTPLLVPWAVAAGAVLYCLSLAVFWWAIAANRVKPLAACFSTESQLHLVQHGPYRLVRHPFYCSYLLAWLAGAVATLNIWLALTAIIMFVLYLSAAVNEENKFASSPLAEEYKSYRGSTGRFFPKPFSLLTRHPH
jgi:protein-S-isoprenylcysteine O-methyltransferase Ste14